MRKTILWLFPRTAHEIQGGVAQRVHFLYNTPRPTGAFQPLTQARRASSVAGTP